MNIPNLSGLVKVVKTFVIANRPEILFGAAVTSAVGSVVLAAKGGYEARGRVEAAQNPSVDLNDPENPLDVKEKAQLTWTCYVPAAIATMTSVGSVTGLHLVHIKEKKALATAAMAALEEVKAEAKKYHDDVMQVVDENVSEKTKGKLDAALEKDGLKEGPFYDHDASDDIVEDLYLVKDEYTGRYITSSSRRIEDAVNEANAQINHSGTIDLNDFYAYAGFDPIPSGTSVGWNHLIEVRWGAESRVDGKPCRVFRFREDPTNQYDPRG